MAGNTASLVIEALSGDDTLTVDSEAGAFSVPITYHGGAGFDSLTTLGGTASLNLYQMGMTPDAGYRTLVIGGVTESIAFTGLEPVTDFVAGVLTVNGTNVSNVITYRQGTTANNGLIAVDDSETIEFRNKTTVTINGLGGNDVINLTNSANPTGLTSILVNGDAGDDVISAIGLVATPVTFNGGFGKDFLDARPMNTGALLSGQEDDDTLLGGSGNDTLDGGQGDDSFVGNGGSDNVGGGAGSSVGDTILLPGTTGADIFSLTLDGSGRLVATVNGVGTTYGNFLSGPIASSGIEQIAVQGLAGVDGLTITNTSGAISIPVNFDGGDNADGLILTGGTATSDIYNPGPNPGEGTSTIVIGGVTQVVTFSSVEPLIDLVAGPLVVNANGANNAMSYSVGRNDANTADDTTRGKVSIDSQAFINFSNKTTLTLNALAGDDTISLGNPNTPTGLTSITVNGGEPSGSDTLIVHGTTGNNTFGYTPSNTVGAGSVTTTGAPTVTFATIEQLSIDGQGGTDAITVTSTTGRRITYTPGSAPDSGLIEVAAFGSGTGLVPLSFAHIGASGSVTFAGTGDILQINGTSNSDTFAVSGSTVQITNTTGGFASVILNLTNFFSAELRGLDGSDTFNVFGSLAALSGGIILDGGNPSTSDTVNLNGATGAVNVTIGTSPTVTGYGANISLLGVERLNANAGGNDATFTATSSDDEVDVTPTGADAVTFAVTSSNPFVGATPAVNFSNVGTTLSVDGGTGTNSLVVRGTATGDTFNLSRNAAALSLAVQGRQAISPTNTFFSWQVLGGAGADSFNVTEPGAILTLEMNLDGGTGTNSLNFTTAFSPGFVPGGGLNGSFSGVGPLSYTTIATASVNLVAPASSASIQANGAANQITLTGIGSSSVQAQVDDSTLVTFAGALITLNVQAGAGDDTILVTPGTFNGVGGIVVNAGNPSANDRMVISGTSGDDTFTFAGTSATDGTVTMAGVAPVTYSNTKNVVIDGLAGADKFLLASAKGAVEIHGGDDSDTVDFTGATAAVILDLDLLGIPQRVNATGETIRLADAIENFIGTSFNDTLYVSAASFPRTLNGGGQATPQPGDTLVFSGASAVVNILPADTNTGTIRTVGFANAGYDEFETRTIVNSPSGPAGFGTPATSEAFSAAYIYDPTLFINGTKPAPGKGPSAVATGDLNGDGFVDLVMVNAKTANLSILINQGNGTFFDPINLPAGTTNPQDIVLGDFDGDTFLDAVVTFPKASKFALFKGDGAGSFAAPVATLTTKFKSFAIAAADLDGDLDLDLAVTSRDTHSIAIMLGNGAGTFAIGAPIKVAGMQPVDIVIADFNGDGSRDIATANALSNNINLFRGNGLGGVANPVRFAAGIRPSGLAAGDLDNDGDIDLAVSNTISRVVSVFLNKGNVAPASQFASQLRVALPGQHQAAAIAIGDFDGDGVADIGLGNGLGTKFTVLRGLGGAIYSQPYDFDLGKDTKINITSAIALADLNNDGLLDIVATSVASNDLRTLLRKF